MTEIFRKSEKKCCSKLLRPGDTFLIKLLSTQGVNDLGVIGKVLASSFEWYVYRQHPESLKISLATLGIYGPVPPEVHWSVKASNAW